MTATLASRSVIESRDRASTSALVWGRGAPSAVNISSQAALR